MKNIIHNNLKIIINHSHYILKTDNAILDIQEKES